MSGGFNPVQLVSQVALGVATGGTSLIAQAAIQIATQVAKQVISQVGQQLGLPPSVINGALGAFEAASGNPAGAVQDYMGSAESLVGEIGGQLNASPSDIGEAQRSVNDAINNMAISILDRAHRTSGSGGGKGWLMAMAEALGKQLDRMSDEMSSMADQMTDKTPSITTKFSAKSQEFGILMNAASTAIKSIGEGMANTARKQ